MPTLQEKLLPGTTSFVMLVDILATAARGGDRLSLALHTQDIVFGGVTYKARPFEISELEQQSGVNISNATFQTMLADAFTRLNIVGGKWQGATTTIQVVDYLNLANGYVRRQSGRLGESTVRGLDASVDYLGLMALLSQEIGDKTSKLCRYQLGDADCKKVLAAYTFTGTVTAVTNNQKFTITTNQADAQGKAYFYRGKITWTSGLNNGLSMETQSNVGTLLTLFQPMLRNVVVGDAYSIVAGDDKRIETCHNKFANAVNFGAEPTVPERERLFHFPENETNKSFKTS